MLITNLWYKFNKKGHDSLSLSLSLSEKKKKKAMFQVLSKTILITITYF